MSGEFESVRNMYYHDEKYNSLTYEDRRQLEFRFFTGSTCPLMLRQVGDPATLYAEVAREHARRIGVDPEAMAKNGPNGHDSLSVVCDRVAELLALEDPKIERDKSYSTHLHDLLMLEHGIHDADALRSRTQAIANNRDEVSEFMAKILAEGQKEPDPREWFYLLGCSRDMCDRWDWDHEYFERMDIRSCNMCREARITREKYQKKMDGAEFVGAVIINMPQPNSSDDESMPGLQDRAMDDCSSVSSANDDDDDDDSIHTDGEMTGWKHKSLMEIISGQHRGILKRRSAAENSEHRLGMGAPVLFNYAIYNGGRPKKARAIADFQQATV